MRGNWRAEQAVRRETEAFRWRLEAVRAQKERRRGAIEVQSFESRTVLWKNEADRNIAAELPCRLLTFAKHLSTCAVAQGAIQSMAATTRCRTTDCCAGVCDAQAKTRNISTGCFSGEHRQI